MVDGSRHNQCAPLVELKFGLIVIFMVHKMIRFDNVKAHLTSSNQEKFCLANVPYVELPIVQSSLGIFFQRLETRTLHIHLHLQTHIPTAQV